MSWSPRSRPGRTQPLPKAPWFEENASWSARRVFVHIIAETAQHSGHADIIRESLDGAKTNWVIARRGWSRCDPNPIALNCALVHSHST